MVDSVSVVIQEIPYEYQEVGMSGTLFLYIFTYCTCDALFGINCHI